MKSPPLQHVSCGLRDALGSEAEEFEELSGGCRFPEPVDADDRTFEPDILAPVIRDAGLHRNAWHAARQHLLAVCGVLTST